MSPTTLTPSGTYGSESVTSFYLCSVVTVLCLALVFLFPTNGPTSWFSFSCSLVSKFFLFVISSIYTCSYDYPLDLLQVEALV
jgi:hypothetical protein